MSLLNQPRWPALKIPASSWKTPNEKILFALVLNEIGAKNEWMRLSRRELQLELSRVGGARVSEKLKSFYEYGYLQRKEPRPINQAYEYRINPDFIESEVAREWMSFTETLFSPVHPWRLLLKRSSIGHGYLNASGLIVLGAIVSAEVGVSTGQLQNYLRGLVSESTIRTSVKAQMRNSLVFRNQRQLLFTSDELGALLCQYEEGSGAKTRSKQVSRNVTSERKNFMEF
jgi:hypothetical protein